MLIFSDARVCQLVPLGNAPWLVICALSCITGVSARERHGFSYSIVSFAQNRSLYESKQSTT